MAVPDFVIIGAQKSASSLLHRCLEEHPGVFMPSDEIPFFEDPDFQQNSRRDLEALFLKANAEQVLGIKRPDYLGKPECAPRIREMLPTARLIVVLRDPVARAVSAYFHQMRFGFIPPRPLNEGFRRLLNGDYKDPYPRSVEIIDFGFYHQHLGRFLDLFPEEQLLVFLHEDVKSDPAGVIQKTFAFVHVDAGYRPRALHSRPMSGIYSLPRVKLHAWVNAVTSDYSPRRTRIYPRRSLLRSTVVGVDRVILSRVFPKGAASLDAAIRDDLVSIYADDITALEGFLERDLSRWKRRTSTVG